MSSQNKKIFVAMSGGVDSSVAAYLLTQQGYDVVGVFMRSFNLDGCAERDADDARKTAAKLGIPFYAFDFEKEYRARVVDYMINAYRNGLTPNPDVMCNKHIKFGVFLDKARSLGADAIATGHYVRMQKQPGTNSFNLYEAKDKNKDQSYFLWTLTQDQLQYCMFPIGEYTKPEVRTIAKEAKLPTAEKKDSQGICFLGKVTLQDFLGEYIPKKQGSIKTMDEEEIGTHNGAFLYTIGQRHLRVSNLKTAQTPYYVAGKDMETNTVIVAPHDALAIRKSEIRLTDINLIDTTRNDIQNMPLVVRFRYRQPVCEGEFIGENCIRLAEPQSFVAPGQSAVFYARAENGDLRLIGGGVIQEVQ